MVAPVVPDQSESPLFRHEALSFTAQRTLGQVSLVQPLTLKVMTALLVAIVGAALLFLSNAEYARKTTVRGYMEPNSGVTQVFPSAPGAIVKRVMVRDGDEVKAGTPLVELVQPGVLAEGGSSADRVLVELRAQEQELAAQIAGQDAAAERTQARLRRRIEEVGAELQSQVNLVELQQDRLQLADEQLDAVTRLLSQGTVSQSRWRQELGIQFDQQKELGLFERQILAARSQLAAAQHELDEWPAVASRERLQLSLQLSRVRQQISETLRRTGVLIEAPVAGRVTALQARPGQAADQGLPLLQLIPPGQSFDCVLLLPSEAMGFIEPGQPVRLMFDAFPYQQFGTQAARLIQISAAPVAAEDLDGLVAVSTPVYIGRARPERDHILAYNQPRQIQPGMLVSADIVLEPRSILQWLLEPFYSLRGRTG